MNKRESTIDVLKGIAICLVVIGHVIQFSAHNIINAYNQPIFKVIYSFHMPLFFFICGYVSFFSYGKHSEKDIVKSRFVTLLIPFFTLTLVNYCYYNISKIIKGISIDNIFYFLLDKLIYPENTAWFLWVLFWIYILYSLIHFIYRKNKGLSIIVLTLIFIFPVNNYCAIYMIKWFFIFFIIGYLCNKHKEIFMNYLHKMRYISVCMYILLICFFNESHYIYKSKLNIVDSSIYKTILNISFRYIIALLGIIIILNLVKYIRRSKNIFLMLSRYTLDIYILQSLFSKIVLKIPVWSYNSIFFNCIYVPVVSILVLTLSLIVSEYFIRRIKILRILFLGNR